MKWLIVGTGKISEKFIKGLIANDQSPFAIFSRNDIKGKEFAKNNQVSKVFTNYQDALDEVEAVYIGTPNTIHYQQAKIAIENKKHVIVEKPMTESLAKTKELFDLAKANQVKIMESYAHINHSKYINLDLKDGDIMEANFERISSKYNKDVPTTSWIFSKDMFGGAIPDLGVYSLSLMIFHFGKVESIKLLDKEYYNDVLAKVTLDVTFKNNRGIAKISKVHNGNDYLIINDQKLDFDSHAGWVENRFAFEVENFIENFNLDKLEFVSLEVARTLDLIKDKMFK